MALERYVVAFEDQAATLATLDVGRLWERMSGEFIDQWSVLDRQGLSDVELEAEMQSFMDGLSDKPEIDLARKTAGVAYNQGRAASILSEHANGRVEAVVRSEVLDEATCATCADIDGMVFEVGTSDFDRYMPPAMCEGGDRCRGFYVVIAEGGA